MNQVPVLGRGPQGHVRGGSGEARRRGLKIGAAALLAIALVAGGLAARRPLPAAEVSARPGGSEAAELPAGAVPPGGLKRTSHGGPLSDRWVPCAGSGGTCRCTGTLVLSTILGVAVREVNVDGEVECTAEALGAPAHLDPRVCWCQRGVAWGDEVRRGLAAMVRQGLTPRVEIASDDSALEAGCAPSGDGLWYGCVTMSKRWDTTVVAQALMRTAPAEEQLDMSLRKLDACHRLAPDSALRVLGVRSGQAADAVDIPVKASYVCSVVYTADEGAVWTGKTGAHYCATQPGTCTTTPCECKRASDSKLELRTPQKQRCWACAEPGKEYQFRVNALAQQMEGTGLSWWPPYGINCPPILWAFMDWRSCISACPVIASYFGVFLLCLFFRRFEEISGGLLPWTRVAPVFAPTLKRGEVWRFFTYTFFHLQFQDLFQNVLTMLDTLDIEGTPAIVLGDGSNLKCGVGAKQNFMCYPSIGIGSTHTLGVAMLSAAIGGMCSTWINFRGVVTGASALGFGLSGAIVALYGLYSGAELDQATSVQRSFQDWCQLRLIFVGFHIVMELIRSISQRDATGLFAHIASFVAGLSYVLYFFPPMGDGSMFPSERPYVVPCAYYDTSVGADTSVPECIRLFSQEYEYEVGDVQRKALTMLMVSIAFTLFNTFVLNRNVPADEAMLLANCEVSAVCCAKSKVQSRSLSGADMNGKDVIVWAEVMGVSPLQVEQDAGEWRPAVEVRILGSDPRRMPGAGLDELAGVPPSEASRCTTPAIGGESLEWKESLFLPAKFAKTSFFQMVLWDTTTPASRVCLGFAVLSMPQALQFNRNNSSDHRLRLQAGPRGAGRVNVDRADMHIRFRCLEQEELRKLRSRVRDEIDDGRPRLRFFEQQLDAMRREDPSSGGAAAVSP